MLPQPDCLTKNMAVIGYSLSSWGLAFVSLIYCVAPGLEGAGHAEVSHKHLWYELIPSLDFQL